MPLIRPGDCVRIKESGSQPLLVFSDGGRSMALVVDEIVDIVEEDIEIEISGQRPGILGSAIVKGEATDIVDVGHYLPIAYADWFGARAARLEQAPRQLLLVDDFGLLPQHADAGAAGGRVTASPLRPAGRRLTASSAAAGTSI